MSNQILNVPDKLKVFVKEKYNNHLPDDLPKGFVVDANNTGRIRTASNWVANKSASTKDKESTPPDIENTFTSGFSISGYSSRYSTDNKVIVLNDPRGWEFELYMPEFLDLIENVTISKGVILESLKYTFTPKTGKILLVKEGDVRGVKIDESTLTKFDKEIGAYYKRKDGSVLKLLGINSVDIKTDIEVEDKRVYGNPKTLYTLKDFEDTIKVNGYVFYDYRDKYSDQYLLQKSPPSNVFKMSESEVLEFLNSRNSTPKYISTYALQERIQATSQKYRDSNVNEFKNNKGVYINFKNLVVLDRGVIKWVITMEL